MVYLLGIRIRDAVTWHGGIDEGGCWVVCLPSVRLRYAVTWCGGIDEGDVRWFVYQASDCEMRSLGVEALTKGDVG